MCYRDITNWILQHVILFCVHGCVFCGNTGWDRVGNIVLYCITIVSRILYCVLCILYCGNPGRVGILCNVFCIVATGHIEPLAGPRLLNLSLSPPPADQTSFLW